ncbi:ORF1 [Anelloviridae sp.]|nr:ORF1 [Anelloviridae sp.]
MPGFRWRRSYRRRRPRRRYRGRRGRRWRWRRFRRARRPARRFRRRRGVRKERLTQWRPSVVRRSTIKGWCPLLVGIPNALPVMMNLETVKNFKGGGASKLHFTLRSLYLAHLKHWNIWTTSNDGTDLCRYMGMKVKFFPHKTYSYIVSWDREFKSEDTYPNFIGHPFLMYLGRQRVIVKSVKDRGGVGKSKTVWIPPPALLSNEWYFQHGFASYALFQFRAALFDPNDHFMGDEAQSYATDLDDTAGIQCPYDVFHDTGEGNLTAMAKPTATGQPTDDTTMIKWAEGYPYWISFWAMNVEGLKEKYSDREFFIKWFPCTNQQPMFTSPKKWYKISVQKAKELSLMGPGVPKNASVNWNIIFQYKSFWQWGGHLPDRTEAREIDPNLNPPSSSDLRGIPVRDPTRAGLGVIHPWDIRRGMLTKRALERITAPTPPEKDFKLFAESKEMAVGIPGEYSETEQSLSEDEPEGDFSSEWEEEMLEPPKKKQKLNQRELRLLRKLSALL